MLPLSVKTLYISLYNSLYRVINFCELLGFSSELNRQEEQVQEICSETKARLENGIILKAIIYDNH